MIDTHIHASTQRTFVRSVREATGYHLPARPMRLHLRSRWPSADRVVCLACAAGGIFLAIVALLEAYL